MSTLKNQFDAIIIGAGLTGLSAAVALEKKGAKVALVESRETPGGSTHCISTETGPLNASLGFVPATDSGREALNWLGTLMGKTLYDGQRELPPLTVESGKLAGFLGFGDLKFKSVSEFSYYNCSHSLALTSQPEQWIEALDQNFSGERYYQSEVTNIIVENEQVTGVVINGAKTLNSPHVVLTPSPRLLESLLTTDWAPKARQKLTKAASWTAVSLHLCHQGELAAVADAGYSPLHFLMGSKTDFEPCLGRLFAPYQVENTTYQNSIWMTLVPWEMAEDMEYVGSAIRHMKRQIKRAYADAFERLHHEKLVVHPESHGNLRLGLKKPGRLPGVEGLLLANQMMGEQRNLLGVVEAARLAADGVELLSSTHETTEPRPEATV